MKVSYDPEVDVLYIHVGDEDTPAVDSVDLQPGISVGLNANGRVIGIEIPDAKEKTGRNTNLGVTFELLGSETIPA